MRKKKKNTKRGGVPADSASHEGAFTRREAESLPDEPDGRVPPDHEAEERNKDLDPAQRLAQRRQNPSPDLSREDILRGEDD